MIKCLAETKFVSRVKLRADFIDSILKFARGKRLEGLPIVFDFALWAFQSYSALGCKEVEIKSAFHVQPADPNTASVFLGYQQHHCLNNFS